MAISDIETAGGNIARMIIEKKKQERDKASDKLKAASINTAILELASQSGNEQDITNASKIVEAIGDVDPEASKLVFSNIQQRIKDKNDFQQTLAMEKYKAGTAAVTEVVKSMAERGGYSPEQLQQIQAESADRVAASLGVSDIAQRVKQSAIEQNPNQDNGFFSEPIPAKTTPKQRDRQEQMQRGSELIDMMEKNYNLINEKYGTGRLKGVATILRGGLGDILPKGEQAPEVKPYLGNLDGIAQFVGRNVYNDDRVSNEDRKAYRKSLAELTASPEEAKIFFNTLRSFTKTGSVKDQEALRMMVDKSGKGMLPSQAIAAVSGDFSKMSLDEKKALLKKKLGQNG